MKKRISKSQTKPITKKNLQEIKHDDYIENVKNFKHYYKDLDIMTKYIIKSQSKNYIYYYCNKKQKGCNGSLKYDIKKKKLFIIEECDINVINDTSNFEEFYESYINNDIKKYDMTITKFKKFYVRLLFKSNQVIDANNIIHLLDKILIYH